MSLSSNQLDAFLQVARSGGFSQAAKALHITQSALSQRILNLEDELGTTLFVRDPKGPRLTEAGTALLRYVQTRELLEAEVLSGLRPGKATGLAGVIRIAGFSTIMRSVILPALTPLLRAHPAVRLESAVRELRDLPAMLRAAEADLVLTDAELNWNEVESELLGAEENVLIEAKSGCAQPEVYLDHDPEDETTARFLRLQGGKATSFQRSFLGEIYAILDAAAAGWGRAVVPRHLLEGRKDLRVVQTAKTLKVPVFLHSWRQAYEPPLLVAVKAALRKGAGPLS